MITIFGKQPYKLSHSAPSQRAFCTLWVSGTQPWISRSKHAYNTSTFYHRSWVAIQLTKAVPSICVRSSPTTTDISGWCDPGQNPSSRRCRIPDHKSGRQTCPLKSASTGFATVWHRTHQWLNQCLRKPSVFASSQLQWGGPEVQQCLLKKTNPQSPSGETWLDELGLQEYWSRQTLCRSKRAGHIWTIACMKIYCF